METLTYLLYIEDDVIPLEGSLTLGNHLDNDVIIAGEDVADFHLRVAVSERGPELIPLGQATVNVNGYEHGEPVRVIIGDVIGVGAETIQVGVEEEISEFRVDAWQLVPEAGAEIKVGSELTFGRSDEATVTINDPHVSRIHARILAKGGHVWLQDLRSANGTRVNGQRLQGGSRLFHGDQISIDRHGFQLVGLSDELTPVNRFVDPLKGTDRSIPTSSPAVPEVFDRSHEGPHLLALETGTRHFLKPGIQKLGSAPECEIRWPDEHQVTFAELELGTDGFVLTRVGGSGTVKVNDLSEDRKTLQSGDRVTLGEMDFQLVIPPTPAPEKSTQIEPKYLVVGGIASIFVLLVLLLLL